MPRQSRYNTVNIIGKQAFDECFSSFYSGLLTEISALNKSDENTLQTVIVIMLNCRFEQKEIADIANVSRTTIGRWAKGQSIPKIPLFREYIVNRLIDVLRETANQGIDYAVAHRPKQKISTPIKAVAKDPS